MADIEVIKKLRSETGHSIAKCKEALEEANGDTEKAREVLREKGALAMQKKADRDLGSGVIQSYIHTTNRIGAMVELLCETDFVAKNEDFITLAREIAIHCAAFQPQYLSRDSIPTEVLKKITAELKESVDTSKPAEVQEKILQGKVDANLKEATLLEQAFVKDDSKTIQDLIANAVQTFGERTEISRFVVWVI